MTQYHQTICIRDGTQTAKVCFGKGQSGRTRDKGDTFPTRQSTHPYQSAQHHTHMSTKNTIVNVSFVHYDVLEFGKDALVAFPIRQDGRVQGIGIGQNDMCRSISDRAAWLVSPSKVAGRMVFSKDVPFNRLCNFDN